MFVVAFGEQGAKYAFESHQWALERVGTISRNEGIDCEYRILPGIMIVEVPDTDPKYSKKNDLPDEVEALKKLGIPHKYYPNGSVGKAYTGAVLEFEQQGAFHPTKYACYACELLELGDLCANVQSCPDTSMVSSRSSRRSMPTSFRPTPIRAAYLTMTMGTGLV